MIKLLASLLLLSAPVFAAQSPFAQLRRGLEAPQAPEPRLSGGDFSHLEEDGRFWVTVSAEDSAERSALLQAGLDIIEAGPHAVSGLIAGPDLEQLAAKGFIVRASQPIGAYALRHLKDFPADDAAYHNYAETEAVLRGLAEANPAETSLFSLGKTTEGRDIWCLRINPAEKGLAPSARPAAFFMGNHHGREHLTNEVSLALARELLSRKGDPEIRKYIDTLDIYIAPMTNPDGAEYDIATGKYRWHRKNTRVNDDKSIGVDLNRNYDSRWCTAGASHYPRSDTYCGPYAFSEPETQAVRDFILARPNITTLMSYHSYGGLVLYPWAGKDAPVENARDRRVFETLGKAMASYTGYKPQRSSDLYVAAGDTTDWAYEKLGIFAFTTELEGRSFYPGAAIIEKASASNVRAALHLLSVADDPYKLAR